MSYNQMIKIINDKSGFTLVEIITSVVIIITISGVFIANYRYAEQETSLSLAAQKMASDIRLAQNNSLGAMVFGSGVPNGGWGINLTVSSSSYILFADTDNDQSYTGDAEKSKIIELPKSIIIASTTKGNMVDTVFLPPDPVTFINSSSSTSVTITLKEAVSGKTKNITVNFLGMIDVD